MRSVQRVRCVPHTWPCTHPHTCSAGKPGRQQPGLLPCPSKPKGGRASSLALPCPCQLGKPQQHQSLCRAGCWMHLNPVQAANRDSCLPSKLPAMPGQLHSDTTNKHREIVFPCVPLLQPHSALSMSMKSLPLIPKPAPPGSEEGAYKAALQQDSHSSAESRESL